MPTFLFLPLYPELLPDGLNLIAGLLIGVAFGFVLEQAGFSSSRRLAGLFYGYDFTVLRVFFTAAITAMSGVLLLARAGWLDLGAVYAPPTFLYPAILGGAIMGVGFILGGYCPGTSVCAAAIGRKDAIVFVLGGFLGVWLYGEAYPAYSGFVNGSALGPVKVYDSLGVSRGGFASFLVVAAIGAFALTSWIEKKVSPEAPSRSFPVRAQRLAAGSAFALALVLFLLPDRETALLALVADPAYQAAHPVRAMSADELAFRLIDEDPRLLVLDVRSARPQGGLALPGAVSVPIDSLLTREARPRIGRRHATRVFVDEDGAEALRAALLADRLGYDDVRVLRGGLAELRRSVLEFAPTRTPVGPDEADAFRFRAEARQALVARIAAARAPVSRPKPAAKKAQGGC